MATVNDARLAHVGPRDPANGFPLWYEDGAGVRLALGLGPDPLLPAIGDLPDPAAPVAFPANYPDEAFYFMAECRMDTGGPAGPGRARVILALEAAFGGTGEVNAQARVVFARIRVRIDDATPGGSYVVRHPYGETEPLEADDRGRVFVTEDLGVGEEDFDRVRRFGRVAPFLTGVGAPAGYLGDGVSEVAVTGSPLGWNFVRITGPGIAGPNSPRDPADPTNPDVVWHDRFTVQGRLATRLGAEPTGATYTRTGGTVILDLHARSAPGQSLETGGAGVPRTAWGSADRSYSVHLQAPAVPALVEVVNVTDVPSVRTVVTPVDAVLVTEADYDTDTRRLSVSATSSDDTGPALVAEGFGALSAAPTVFDNVDAVPFEVVVTSAAGGLGRRPITVTGSPAAPLPLLADAGPDITVLLGDEITLDGTGSRGDITTFGWSQPSGPPLTLDNPSSATTTARATGEGAVVVRLDVSGPGGSASDTTTVTVAPTPPPDVLTITGAQFRTSKAQYRVDGTVSGVTPAQVVVRRGADEIGRSAVDATGAWSVRRTLATDDPLRPSVGDVLTATSAHGGSASIPLRIRN